MTKAHCKIRPTVTDRYLPNPHRGCCTFQHFNGDPLFPGTDWSEVGPTEFEPTPRDSIIEGYLPTTVAYCRWYWEVLEPEQGRYDFSMIEGALDTCKQRGQTLAVRLMPLGCGESPLPQWFASKYPTVKEKSYDQVEIEVPVYDSPEYLEHFGGMILAFAERFADHPLLESVDMAYLGPWGEGGGACGDEQIARFTRMYGQAFPNIPRLAMIGGQKMRVGIAEGAGWRCDCYGDLKSRGTNDVTITTSWNHMYEMYPAEVARCGASDTWKTAPVHLETCWVPMAWYHNERDIDFILQQGRKYHATYFMPKYTRLPEAWMEKLANFCNHLGYRYVYRQAKYDAQVTSGGRLHFESWIENVGVAPIYRRYDFALRFRQGDREQVVVLDDVDVRRWLPGDVWIERDITIPMGFRAGRVALAAGLVDSTTHQPRISFATTDEYADRWVDLGGFDLLADTTQHNA